MAEWSKILSRGNVEDRRGSPLAIGGSFATIAIMVIFSLLSGESIDVGSILNQLPAANVPSTLSSKDFEGEDDYEKFASTVLGSNNELWRQTLAKNNQTYEDPKLVLFRTATQTGCGTATSQVGPHYCPLDSTIYIDETFFDELVKQFNAKGGDVAEAYVIAHEVGHHVQYQLGIIDVNRERSNEDSVKTELQADCFAGIWAKSVSGLGVFQPGEINEALDAAAAVGDDRIQKTVQGQINPETWTHGSSQQRVEWFNIGFESGEPSKCNTSSA